MAASDQTYRNQKALHVVFAVSSAIDDYRARILINYGVMLDQRVSGKVFSALFDASVRGDSGGRAQALRDLDQHARLAHDQGVAIGGRRRLNHVGDIANAYRGAAGGLDLPGADIVRGHGLAVRLDHHPLIVGVDEAGAGDAGGALHGTQDVEKAEVAVGQVAGPRPHLDAPDLAAIDGDARHARGGEQPRPDGPLHHVAQRHGVKLVAGEADLEHVGAA